MDGKPSTSSQLKKPKAKPKAEVKDSLDTWLNSLGANLPQEKLKAMQEQVKRNPKLAYYLHFIKNHSRPRAEVIQMKKSYLYKTISDGELKDIPENITVTCNRDVELLRKYNKLNYKTEALELVKIPQAEKELEKYSDILSKKNHQLRVSTETFIKNTGHLKLLTSTHNNLNKIIFDVHKIIDCFKAFLKPEKGSKNLKKILALDEEHIQTIEKILNISCADIDRRNSKKIYPLIIECYKKILCSYDLTKVVKCTPKRYLASIRSSLVSPASKNSRATPLNPDKIMDDIEKFKYLFTTVKDLRFTIKNYFDAYEKFNLRNSELLLKTNSIDENIKALILIKSKLGKNAEINATFLTPRQFATIKQIFNKWGEEVECSENILSNCIKCKQTEYENCQLLLKLMSTISSRQFSIDFNYEHFDTFMNSSLVKFSEFSVKIPDLIKTDKHVGIEILKLLKSMSFFKINNVPITNILQDVKQTIVDDELAQVMSIE